jgi:hypothetical protein
MSDKPLKDRFSISTDELTNRMQLQDKHHDAPLRSVTDLISDAIGKVLRTLGVDTTQSDEMVTQQQLAAGITISEHFPEEMGKLSGFYVTLKLTPIAIICDPYLASDGLAYLNIMWVQVNLMEKFGGVKVI